VSGAVINLAWVVPSTRFALQQSGDLAGGWTDVTDPVVLNFTNISYGLTITPINAQNFYRLAQP
jgi:hypothetical protein